MKYTEYSTSYVHVQQDHDKKKMNFSPFIFFLFIFSDNVKLTDEITFSLLLKL